MSDYYKPVKIIKTNDWLKQLHLSVKNLDIKNPVIITTPGNRKRLNLDSSFPNNSIFSNLGINPNFDDSYRAIVFCNKKDFDSVIAIGGGSAMDLAKVVMSHLSLKISNVKELINFKENYDNIVPSIFLPTTHGTASEVTMWGTIWNIEEKKKYSISHINLYPKIAILDGSLTLSLPIDISITTIMDALSHGLEAIWNKNSNPKSTGFAISAICSILNNIDEFKSNTSNLIIRNKLLEASTISGLAFSNTTTAAAHSISYPLTMHYGIPHGIASSITLIPLLNINGSRIVDSLNVICDNLDTDINSLKKMIENIPDNIINYKLSSWGINKSDITLLAKESFTKGRMDNNIVDLSEIDVVEILKEIYI